MVIEHVVSEFVSKRAALSHWVIGRGGCNPGDAGCWIAHREPMRFRIVDGQNRHVNALKAFDQSDEVSKWLQSKPVIQPVVLGPRSAFLLRGHAGRYP